MQPRVSLCPNCHSQIALGQQFCVNCGARFCPHCCAAVPTRSRFCPNCGFLLGTAQPREAAQPPPTAAAQPPSPMPIMPSPPYQASPQPATQYQPPEAPGMWQQYNCPQCGASIDIVSGQCTSCGLLLGKNIIQKMQQEATPAAPAASTTPTPINPPSPPSSQSASGQQYPGGYITGAQHNYPPPDAPTPPGPKYPPNYGLPGATPYSETQQHVASATPIAMNPPAPAIPFPGKVRPAPGEQGAPLLTRRSLVRIATSLLLAIPILIIIYYAIIQLGIATPPSTDTTPPTIQSTSVSSVTETTAVIEWVTDEPATSQVSICTAAGNYCTWTELKETLVTNHSVTLNDLEPGTTYHYTAISKDASGKEATSEGELTTLAQTDTTPPMISEINVSNINESSSSATIEWKTDEPATSQVEYGTTNTYGLTTPLDDELTTSHSVTLTGPEPDATSYRFKIKSKDASGNEATAIPAGSRAGYRAPDFTLQSIDGQSLTLSDLQGIVMVNFWFIGCIPCEDEMPHIQAVSKSWSGELTVLAINRWENAEEVQDFVDSKSLTFPVLIDSLEEVHDNYNVSVWPTTFFIDTEGIIQEIQAGAFGSQDEIETILESL